VVDDDEQVREMICSILTSCGYDIAEATGGKVATRMYREQPFDVVITDLVMPDMEGIELIKELRGIDQNVKIIAMSGGFVGASQTYLKVAKLMGALHTLAKPFDMDELLNVVSAALAQA
jgi:DNA-binding response OmpR family regulator